MESIIREPKQKRAVEKKEKIIDAGFELICINGYYNTNTAEIAKKANVSTGIIYQYFKDKHDIFMAGLEKYGDDIFYPMLKVKDNIFNADEFQIIMRNMIDNYIKNHKVSSTAHEEIMSMTHSDPDVAKYYKQKELDVTFKITNLLLNNGFNDINLKEKVHVVIGLIDNLCHEVVYHKHKELNYNIMIDIVIESIIKILK